MAARATASAGSKPDKIIRDAIILQLNRMTEDDDGKKVKYLQRIAAKLVESAAEGKIDAIKEIADRVDGRPAPQIAIAATGGNVYFMLQNGPDQGESGPIIDATPLQITGESDGS